MTACYRWKSFALCEFKFNLDVINIFHSVLSGFLSRYRWYVRVATKYYQLWRYKNLQQFPTPSLEKFFDICLEFTLYAGFQLQTHVNKTLPRTIQKQKCQVFISLIYGTLHDIYIYIYIYSYNVTVGLLWGVFLLLFILPLLSFCQMRSRRHAKCATVIHSRRE